MKNIYKIFFLFLIVFGITSSCDKNENFEILPAKESFKITTPSSGSVIVLDDTNLSNKALFISWKSTTATAGTYSIEVAETGTDFANPVVLGTTESVNFSMTVDELNTFLLDIMELKAEKATSLDIRVSANGEVSQIISVVLTPYKVEYEEFYLVGSLTNWKPEEALAMTRLDVNLFEITLDLADGDEFKFLPTNTSFEGDWGKDPNNEGVLIVDGEQNLAVYAAGKYKISVDLNTFTFAVVEIIPPSNIAVPGNHQGWDPPSAPLLASSSPTTTDYEGFVWLDGEFKFLAPNDAGEFQWGNVDWGDASGVNGSYTQVLVADGEGNCGTANAEGTGYYLVKADTDALTYNLTKTNWGVIGNATPTGWDSDTDMVYDASSKVWTVTLDLTQQAAPDNGIKFRANDGWDINIGDNDGDGTMEFGGQNMGVPEDGNYTITLDLSNPRAYTYSLVKN